MRWNWVRRAPPSERRAAPRYRPVRADVLVAWRDDAGAFVTVPATVRDLSQGGALLAVAAPRRGLAIRSPVWVRPGSNPDEPWAEARPVAWRGRAFRPGSLRVAFPDGCPYQLYLAILHGGAVMPRGPDRCVDAHFDDRRYWH